MPARLSRDGIGQTEYWCSENFDSLTDTYAHATIVINPVKFGTGLPVKTLEALSYGKPVVATPAGVRGLGLDFDAAVALGDKPDTFAEQVLKLLKDENARSAMAQQAISAANDWQHRQLAVLNNAIAGQKTRA